MNDPCASRADASAMSPITSAAESAAEAKNTQLKTQRILVWDVPVRVFHWLMVLSFAGAYLTAEGERWRLLHVTLGYTMAGLVAFRILWGLMGTKYARFSTFVRGPQDVARYVDAMLRGQPEHHIVFVTTPRWHRTPDVCRAVDLKLLVHHRAAHNRASCCAAHSPDPDPALENKRIGPVRCRSPLQQPLRSRVFFRNRALGGWIQPPVQVLFRFQV